MPAFVDLKGSRFGRLKVTARFHPVKKSQTKWLCVCDCGNEIIVFAGNLTRGHTKSCGCLTLELRRTHGLTDTGEYRIYRNMLRRCCSPKDKRYSDYGGRGIGVCESWRDSFEAFYTDMGPRPSSNHSLDRINNDGWYSLENCKWSTGVEQQNNTRRNVIVEHDSRSLTLAQWARELNVNTSTLRKRLSRGWSVAQAFRGFR